jgi:hypothetical protein
MCTTARTEAKLALTERFAEMQLPTPHFFTSQEGFFVPRDKDVFLSRPSAIPLILLKLVNIHPCWPGCFPFVVICPPHVTDECGGADTRMAQVRKATCGYRHSRTH